MNVRRALHEATISMSTPGPVGRTLQPGTFPRLLPALAGLDA